MQLTITPAELYRTQAVPLPWWSDGVREVLGLAQAGEPGIETDANGAPTGNLLLAHRSITAYDVWLLDVMRARWAHADSLDDDGAWEQAEAAADWAAWHDLADKVARNEMTAREARAALDARGADQADDLGVAPMPEPDPA